MPEWLNGTVSKTVVGLVSTEGSNPSLPAKQTRVRVMGALCFSSERPHRMDDVQIPLFPLTTLESFRESFC
jgi:hypothetical protein